MEIYKKNWLKLVIGFVACFLIRLIPFRPPNIEPILATNMPFSKHYGPWVGFCFAFFSILLFDIFTGQYGVWSYLTAGTYGVLGFYSFYFFKNKTPARLDYARFAVVGTLFFDGVTGLSLGPLFFNQPFMQALVGQVPFTLWHLLGNVSFALVLSPAVYDYVVQNERLETSFLFNALKNKKAL